MSITWPDSNLPDETQVWRRKVEEVLGDAVRTGGIAATNSKAAQKGSHSTRRAIAAANLDIADQQKAIEQARRVPAAPSDPAATSDAYFDEYGYPKATVYATVVKVTTDVHGVEIDVPRYELFGRPNVSGESWALLAEEVLVGEEDPQLKAIGLPAGEEWAFKVRAVSDAGVVGEFSAEVVLTLAKDETPPPKPAAPTGTSRLGQVIIEWTGLTATGTAQPADFSHAEVGMATSLAGAGTIVGRIGNNGDTFVAPELPYNSARWYYVVGVDFAGNRSVESDRVEVVTKPAVDTDFIGRVLDGANIKLDSIQADVIEAGAITEEKISEQVNDKITGAVTDSANAIEQAGEAKGLATDAQFTADGKNRIYSQPLSPGENLFLNGSFEDASGPIEARRNHQKWPGDASSGTVGWVGYRSSVTNPGGYIRAQVTEATGANAAGLVGVTGTGNMTPANPGEPWSFSAELRATNLSLAVSLQFFDASGVFISGSQAIGPSIVGHPTTWRVATVTTEAPAGAAYIRGLALFADSDVPLDRVLHLRRATLEKGSTPQGAPFSGNASPDSDLTPSWVGTAGASESILTGEKISTIPVSAQQQCIVIRSTRWASSGGYSARVIPTAPTANSTPYSSVAAMGGVNGKTYTAFGKLHLESPLAGVLNGSALSMGFAGKSVSAPNEAGTHDLRLVFTVGQESIATNSLFRLYNGAAVGNGDVWWDDLILVEGDVDRPFVQGDLWYVTDPANPSRVTGVKIWNGTAWADHQIVADSVIVPGSVGGTLIKDGVVTTIKLDALAVTAAKIAAGAVVADKILGNTITGDKLVINAVTAREIAALSVAAGAIQANAVTADKINAGAVTTVKLDALAVTAAKIAADAIEADKIKAGAVTATKISADAIDGKTITGAIIRSSATGARTEMTASGIRVLNSSSQELVKLGYGIATGMEVRNPSTGTMVPLANAAFGMVSVANTDALTFNAAVSANGTMGGFTRHGADTCELTFTAVSSKYIIQFGQTWTTGFDSANFKSAQVFVQPVVNAVPVTVAGHSYNALIPQLSAFYSEEVRRITLGEGTLPLDTTPGTTYTVTMRFATYGSGGATTTMGLVLRNRFITATPVFQ